MSNMRRIWNVAKGTVKGIGNASPEDEAVERELAEARARVQTKARRVGTQTKTPDDEPPVPDPVGPPELDADGNVKKTL